MTQFVDLFFPLKHYKVPSHLPRDTTIVEKLPLTILYISCKIGGVWVPAICYLSPKCVPRERIPPGTWRYPNNREPSPNSP